NEFEYASQTPGVMHACGHDTHVAMGMGVASILAKNREHLKGSVKFVFQPAEEGAGGARAMIEDGVLENPKPDYCFGIHIESNRQSGLFLIGSGPILTAADYFRIDIQGRGGHCAQPEETVDALKVGVQIVNTLQTIQTRNIGMLDPAIVSVTSFQSGTVFNIIPDRATLLGTIRTYDPETQQLIYQRMREIVTKTAEAFGATASIEIKQIVPVLFNDPELAELASGLAEKIVGSENVSDYQSTPSDDVAEFLSVIPGCQIIMGAGVEAGYPHHHPRFDIDESTMPLGVALFCMLTDKLLS
ncbi:MAG: amidohydrolase, partial [Anaerolineaceae bacterium]|nr:amidohydrolase [Anaerolineaceae bacterium]